MRQLLLGSIAVEETVLLDRFITAVSIVVVFRILRTKSFLGTVIELERNLSEKAIEGSNYRPFGCNFELVTEFLPGRGQIPTRAGS